jgi:hypothetical protein
MLRPVAAGLMCLGLATLGVTALRGQETGQSDLIAGDAPVAEGAPVPAGEGLVEIEIRNEGDIVAGAADGANVELLGEDVIYRADDGRVVETIRRAAPRLAAANVRVTAGPPIDPATRETLDKIIAGLKEEAKRLQDSGKAEEAQQKLQSIRAIEQLLNSPRRARFVVQRPGIPDGPAAEEIKKLHERIDELRTQAGRQPQDPEAHAKVQKEMAELHRKLAELHHGAVFGGMMPGGRPGMPGQPGMPGPAGMPGQPGMPVHPGGYTVGGFGGAAPGQYFGIQFQQGGIPVEAAALSQKSAALMQAAAQLQQAGLEDQARDLKTQAAKLQVAANKIRAEARPAFGGGGFAGGPPGDLLKTIHELQEQIQQLRKDVGELRELLQRQRPTRWDSRELPQGGR